MIYQLDDNDPYFPAPDCIPDKVREKDGCIAVGGKLTPEWLLEAYTQGIFPWFAFRWSEIYWYCPMQRFVIFPSEIHISHSMRTLLNRREYACTYDQAFEQVIHHCSQLRIHERGAWLGPEMVDAYTEMHRLGYAHSVEVWRGEELVGGLYGMQLGHGFMGESMFSIAPSASKVALIHLAKLMQEIGVNFIDCQFETPHLKSMGGRYIPYSEYMQLLLDWNPQMK